MNNPKIIVSLDYARAMDAEKLTSQLDPDKCRLKIGKELFTSAGPVIVERLRDQGFDIFLDLKYHDIPNTVARACEVAADLGVWMLNVHACGGRAMLNAAREAIDKKTNKPILIAVTVLTSLSTDDLLELGITGTTEEHVSRMARLTQECGLDGVVCSALEVVTMREIAGPDFKLVTPGIRPTGSSANDQKRVMTPSEAIRQGSDYLVIGRPITQAADPLKALLAVDSEIAGI